MALERFKNWMRINRTEILIILGIFTLAAVPRVVDLGAFLTADEKNWIGRSYEFVRAFKDLRFNDMLQTTHPGVTTLWLSGATITARIITSHVPFSFQHLRHFVVAAQLPIALANTLAIPLGYLLLRRLFSSWWLAVVGSVIIALDPFLIGYSRVVHVDALLASFMFLAALSILLYAKENYSRNWLLLAALFSGLAILTKAPAIFLIPFFVLVVLVSNPAALRAHLFLKDRTRDFVTWLLIVVLLFILIWPAILWVPNPTGNVLVLKRDLSIATLTPHNMTEDYTLNVWHYPAALLTRTTPVTLVFGVIAVGWLVLRSRKYEAGSMGQRKTEWLLVAYVFFFVVMMTLGAKKGDRYILPVWPALDVLAAIGLLKISGLIQKKSILHTLYFILPVLTLLYLFFTVYRYHPYTLAYSNPLFPSNLSQEVGWGEGLEQVADWLNKNAPNAVVASWYPEELGAYTTANVAHINAHEQGSVRYIVLYHNMFGRAPEHPANDFIDEYYKKREPVFVARVLGEEFAWVYEKRVYERNMGELLPPTRAGQYVEVTHDNLVGIDLALATFSGRASTGEVQVELRESLNGSAVHSWRTPVKDIKDGTWTNFSFDEPAQLRGKKVFVDVRALGTRPDDAPTLRYTNVHDYRVGGMLYAKDHELSISDEKKADLAIRLRYNTGNQVATEEDSKLLK